jgi:hypothetical protein
MAEMLAGQPLAGLGHNLGPTMEAGASWRRHCWTAARESLLPHLPIEVLRGRLRRARELGLEYKTYASVRAASGHDVVAFLFSSNALRLLGMRPLLPQDRAEKLTSLVECGRLALVSAPLIPEAALRAAEGALQAAFVAPGALASFTQSAALIQAARAGLPGDRVLLVGDMALEQGWCAAGRLAGYVPAERYFAA